MMKCRIRAVFAPFFSSIIGRRDAASLKLSVALLNSFRFKVEDLRQTVHNSAFEDDDDDDDDSFSELGQQFEPRKEGFLKLLTEKTDNITKHNHRSKNKSAPSKVLKDSREPESADSGQPAIYAARIKVESSNLLIHPCPADEMFTVRINGICTKTSDYTVCAVCGSFCILLGIKRTGKTSVDAVFRVKDQRKRNKLLKRLSSTIKDGCQWTAHEEPSELSSPGQKKSEQCVDLAIDIKRQITDMRDEIIWKKLLCDDLINLHRSIMSLEGQHKDLPDAD